ncbi:Rid family detoxifying hydrolase [Aerococcaceae bacterium NML190938]|nr:Rid family detoxifying hydrolase [Aerococcaceae bacterium NML191219]MCW6666715.1 Rid family detoxifying hydrolase [Aerococcaceae bacterium NML190938]MCW6680458.1 Rid family detoxifying hydrolase [Aerococcaceae bacterium NML130460]MDO4775477.1 Rid family detoxifying hydrolase [Aerococcaceae bacterium]
MKVLQSNLAPAAVGPYSQAVETGNLVFLSGQLGIDRQTGQLVDGIEAQTAQAFKNIEYVLAEAGLTLANVVKVLVLLADINDFATVNGIYAEQFSEPYPARSAFAVQALPLGARVEIEVIAEKEAK